MSSEATTAATQFRLQEWAAQIRECQNRPDGMSVIQWCTQHGITKANYYYRLRRVREACLRSLPQEMVPQPIVPVVAEMLHHPGPVSGSQSTYGLEVSIKGVSIHLTETSSMHLLSQVLEVIWNAE